MSDFIIPPEADVAFSYAPGKVILIGEHAVVYGSQAIAVPIEAGVRVAISRLNNQDRGPMIRGVGPFMMGDIHIDNQSHGPQVLKQALSFLLNKFGREFNKLSIMIDGSLPPGRGLGSSAAFSVALIRGLYRFFSQELTNQKILSLALELETIFHGQPSGIDHSVVIQGQPIGFKKINNNSQIWPIKLACDLGLVIGLVGPHDGTKHAVAKLADRKKRHEKIYQRIFAELDYLAQELEQSLIIGHKHHAGELMNIAQGYLNSLSVSTPEIEKLCSIARDRGALGAKLTGAGGGGAVIALADGNEQAIINGFRSAGYQTLVTKILAANN